MNSTALRWPPGCTHLVFHQLAGLRMSRAENGSSIRMMSGSTTSVCARLARLRMPPLTLVRVAVAETCTGHTGKSVCACAVASLQRRPRYPASATRWPTLYARASAFWPGDMYPARRLRGRSGFAKDRNVSRAGASEARLPLEQVLFPHPVGPTTLDSPAPTCRSTF